MFSLYYMSDSSDNASTCFSIDIEIYSIYNNETEEFLSFAVIRIDRTGKQICFSNFDNIPIAMRKDIYELVRGSKDELDINGYKVSPFYSGYRVYKETYCSEYI